MSGYNLSSILEQVTRGSRVPKKRNSKPTLDFRLLGSQERGNHPGSEFLGTESETDTPTPKSWQIIDESWGDFHQFILWIFTNWRKFNELSSMHSLQLSPIFGESLIGEERELRLRQAYCSSKSGQWLMIILFILFDTLLTLFIVKLRKIVLTILLRGPRKN
jgi:hypothetical protein